MVLAGFAGSPQMISATLLALTRIMYTFKGKYTLFIKTIVKLTLLNSVLLLGVFTLKERLTLLT